MRPDVTKVVAKGAALLDDNFPGWAQLIDFARFDLSSCDQCICGQIAHELLDLNGADAYCEMLDELEISKGADYGFSGTHNRLNTEVCMYEDLEREWKNAVDQRLPAREVAYA